MATLTLQPDTSTGIDTYSDASQPDVNDGGAVGMLAGVAGAVKGQEFGYSFFSYLRFDISSIQVGSTINSSTLTLYNDGNSSSATHLAYSIGRENNIAWTRLGLTWNKYDGAHAWANGPGGAGVGDYVYDSQIVLADDTADLVFNTAALVADAINNRSGILSVLVSGNGNGGDSSDAYVEVHTSRSVTAAKRPKLIVNFTAPSFSPAWARTANKLL